VDAGRRLRLQDVVKLLPQPAAPPPSEEAVKIHYLDAQVVVVEKPSGVTSTRHSEERTWSARRKQLQSTLDEILSRILAKREPKRGGDRRKGSPPPVRAVHRLDRDTSGLMVFARTAAAELALAQQFRKHTTHRRYLAIVQGSVEAHTISSRLVRDRGDGRRGSTTLPNLGKTAVTHVRPLEDLGGYTLVECRLETGRTHQIRIHLSEEGHPVCGEKVYRQGKFARPSADTSGAPRLALHAVELGFVHPTSGEELRWEMPLPPDLDEFLTRLRKQAKRTGKKEDESGSG
jgi:23S rRNA pseudouridine1911/1915/1917 synthase